MNSVNMIILYVLASYIIGSISGSLVLGKLWKVDIREVGSGNAGGTNALRSVGVVFALLTVIIDISKGAIPCYFMMGNNTLMLACGMAAVVGHVFPVFYGFKGGKGAGTLLGVIIIYEPSAVIYLLSTWIVSLVITGYVGFSTMLATLALFVCSFFYGDFYFIIFSAVSFLFIVFNHRDNISRMLKGEENRFSSVMIFKKQG